MYYTHFLLRSLIGLFWVSITSFVIASKEMNIDLEWQLPGVWQEHSFQRLKFRAQGIEAFEREKPSAQFTGKIRVTGQAGQLFILCAQDVSTDDFYFVVQDPESVNIATGHVSFFMLELAGQSGELAILRSQPCPGHINQPYDFYSGQSLRSDKPFLTVRERKTEPQENNQITLTPEPESFSVLPTAFADDNTEKGSGGGFDTGDSHDFKRPSFMPVLNKVEANLILLPTLNLPVNWRDYLPFANLYHWFSDASHDGVTVLIRLGNQPFISLRISQAESRELTQHLTSTRQLLLWLAPRLNGRELLVQQLLALSEDSAEQSSLLPEETLAAIQKQLAIVLEQPDTEFSLEFESSELAHSLSGQVGGQPEEPLSGEVNRGGRQQSAAAAAGEEVARIHQKVTEQKRRKNTAQDTGNELRFDAENEKTEQPPVKKVNSQDSYVVRSYQTRYRIIRAEVLSQLHTPVEQTNLFLSCLDCLEIIPIESITSHSQGHFLNCERCNQFKTGDYIKASRMKKLEEHTESQCQQHRGEIPTEPFF